MREITPNDLLAIYPHSLKRGSSSGHPEWTGSCWLCGGRDRFSIYIGRNGKTMWRCREHERARTHGNQNRGYFFGDILYEQLTGKKWETDPSARALTRETRQPVQQYPDPPKWDDLLTNPVNISMEMVKRCASRIDIASRYFGRYKIENNTLARFYIGYVEGSRTRLDAGYLIPNVSYGACGEALRGAQIRRDEAHCQTIVAKRGDTWLRGQISLLADEWLKEAAEGKRTSDSLRNPTETDVIDWLWPKYTSITGNKPGIWGDNLITLPDDSRQGPRLEYIFVVEDAKSAMVLRQLKYPAVAYKPRYDWNFWLPRVFKRCANVYIIADRDDEYNNSGKGWLMAQQLAGFIRVGSYSNVRITMPPVRRNDVADIARDDGLDAVEAWLSNKFPGLMPLTELAIV